MNVYKYTIDNITIFATRKIPNSILERMIVEQVCKNIIDILEKSNIGWLVIEIDTMSGTACIPNKDHILKKLISNPKNKNLRELVKTFMFTLDYDLIKYDECKYLLHKRINKVEEILNKMFKYEYSIKKNPRCNNM